jgi:Uma2 family endonuclease
MTITRKLTAEQLARLPAYNHNREELIRGTLTVLEPGPGYTHGSVAADGAPDLAVEIWSRGNKRKDMAEHVALYLRTGSRLVWVVDPQRRTVTVHRPNHEQVVLGGDDQLSGEDVLPGFACCVADFFYELR